MVWMAPELGTPSGRGISSYFQKSSNGQNSLKKKRLHQDIVESHVTSINHRNYSVRSSQKRVLYWVGDDLGGLLKFWDWLGMDL